MKAEKREKIPGVEKAGEKIACVRLRNVWLVFLLVVVVVVVDKKQL